MSCFPNTVRVHRHIQHTSSNICILIAPVYTDRTKFLHLPKLNPSTNSIFVIVVTKAGPQDYKRLYSKKKEK